MTRTVAVLRPEPGNAASVARIAAAGLRAIRMPLFAVAPIAWVPPDPHAFDALLLTSANAVRQGGPGLDRLKRLPVFAVGAATAMAASAAGFDVAETGTEGVDTLLAMRPAATRLLHLAGRERMRDMPGVQAITVYGADALPIGSGALAALDGGVALLHSVRAARRLAELIRPNARGSIRIAALSDAIARAAGQGWAACVAAPMPHDDALVALAAALAD